MKRALRWRTGALLIGSSLLLTGCGSWNWLNPVNWFGASKPKPTPLEAFSPKLKVDQAWTARIDDVGFPLAVTVAGGQFVVASSDGIVTAFNVDSGREAWHADAKEKLTAGVGSDGRFSAVVTRDNELVVFEGAAVKWRQPLNSRTVTAPLVAGERVFVMGVDRAVNAFDALDGRLIWTLQRPGDALTLSEPSIVAAFKDTLLVGQGARLTGIDPTRGAVRWDVPMATPRGTNEVERLADLVGPPARVGDVVCARAFQSAVACADAERAAVVWSKNVGGIQPVAADDTVVVGGDANDKLTAWRIGNGDVAWTNERFLHRELSGVANLGAAFLVGDAEGYVHFISRETGETLNRLPTDGSPIAAVPVRSGNTVLVVTRKGGLFAFRTE